MRPHHKLIAWQTAIELVNEIYLITMKFPDSERFGIISQLRRAAVSVSSNIAEGAARNTKKEFIQFNFIALGSVSEIDTLLVISKNLSFINKIEYNKLYDKIRVKEHQHLLMG